MSTRSQIIIKSESDGDEQWFYRHSDGYPEENLPQLRKFLKWLKEGKIRNNVEQSAGWLILIGAEEYNTYYKDGKDYPKKTLTEPTDEGFTGWKCGAYEICTCDETHGDVEWLYTIDLDKKQIRVKPVRGGKEYIDNGKTETGK